LNELPDKIGKEVGLLNWAFKLLSLTTPVKMAT
jgi:hypothetical protein